MEMMSGQTPTLEQYWVFPANSSIEWTDWLKPMYNISSLLDTDYSKTLAAVNSWLNSSNGVSLDKINEIDQFFNKYSSVPVKDSDLLYRASPWGALQERMTGKKLAASTLFSLDENDEQIQQWLELINTGTFSENTLNQLIPKSYLIAEDWQQLIENSTKNHVPSWLHYLHEGVAQAEAGFIGQAINYFTMSINLKPNPVAYRNLALLVSPYDQSYKYFMEAWSLISLSNPNTDDIATNLASEIALFLVDINDYTHLDEFLKNVPSRPPFDTRDHLIVARAMAALHHQDYKTVISILQNSQFPSLGNRRKQVVSMWNEACYMQEQVKLGRPLTPVDRHLVRLNNPVPRNIYVDVRK